MIVSEPLDWMVGLSDADRARFAASLDASERAEFAYHWALFARHAQRPPKGDWRIWLICAGRGFGKTRAGAEWVREVAKQHPAARIALVAASLAEARAVMVEGESGIIACSPPSRAPVFEPSLQRLRFPNGALAQLYSAAEPERLRGPQHSHGWCDEIGKWPLAHDRATRCWDNLQLGLRVGPQPRTVVTTTPRAVPLVRRLLDPSQHPAVAVASGSTYDNAGNLPHRFLEAIAEDYAGSQLARQEIAGQLVDDVEGALWTRSLLERTRETGPRPDPVRVVVAVDPPASSAGDSCGIVVVALGQDGFGRVLADCSIERASPEQWARRVAGAAAEWHADRVVAEANIGGDMVASVLRAAGQELPIKLVRARRGKTARAEPVAALYESGRVRHCGIHPQLEDQMCGMIAGGEYAGPGRSPDRADALVWGLTELMLSRAASPAVRAI